MEAGEEAVYDYTPPAPSRGSDPAGSGSEAEEEEGEEAEGEEAPMAQFMRAARILALRVARRGR
jgi:hypothetical protein